MHTYPLMPTVSLLLVGLSKPESHQSHAILQRRALATRLHATVCYLPTPNLKSPLKINGFFFFLMFSKAKGVDQDCPSEATPNAVRVFLHL